MLSSTGAPSPAVVTTASTLPVVFRGKRTERKGDSRKCDPDPRVQTAALYFQSPLNRIGRLGGNGSDYQKQLWRRRAARPNSQRRLAILRLRRLGLLSALRSCSALFQLVPLSLLSAPDVSRLAPNAAGLHLQIHLQATPVCVQPCRHRRGHADKEKREIYNYILVLSLESFFLTIRLKYRFTK